MGKQKKPKVPVVDYSLSVHMGIALGPLDSITEVWTGEKLAWSGEQITQGDVLIRNLNLYGGPEREGGVEGIMHYLPGGQSQIIPENIASKFGLTSDTMPAFRGVTTAFFHGGIGTENESGLDPAVIGWLLGVNIRSAFPGGSSPNGVKGKPGFYWQSQNPNLKTVWIRARRAAKGLDPGLAIIENVVQVEDSNSVSGQREVVYKDANGAHIIYECLTNTDFGMGATGAMIDEASFLIAAQTLYDERFGLSMMWTQQDTIENFVTEVLDHIQATLFVNPKTGLITIKLLRDDYVAEEAQLFTPDNCIVQKFARKGEGEIINEITVTYTNPVNEEEVTITQQNLAGIASAGGIVPDGRNYYGIRRTDLAAMVLNRDLRSAGIPLAKCEMVVNREGWTLTPGSVLRLTYPEHGLNEVVFRVGAINYGRSKDTTIRVTLTEDVFGYDPGDYVIPSTTQWRDTSQQPEPFAFEKIVTLPYYMARQIDDLDEGVAFIGALAAPTQSDAWGFDLLVQTTLSDGTLSYELSGRKSISGRAVTNVDLDAEATSLVNVDTFFSEETEAADVLAGGFLFVGDGDETEQEVIYVRNPSSNSGGLYVFDRGMLDTVPRAWPAGTPVWFVDPTVVFYDDSDYVVGANYNFKFLTRTSLGRLEEEDAPVVVGTISERPHLPNRPANVRVLGEAWDEPSSPPSLLDDSNSAGGLIDITWARRNRDYEDSTLLRWTDGDIAPPAGVVTRISVYALDRTTLWFTADTLEADTSYNLDPAEFDGPVGVVRVTSVDADGNESLQGHEITVRVRSGGYGFDYGLNYGGA